MAERACDLTALDRLRRLGGDELAERVVGSFLATTPERLVALEHGSEVGDLPLVERVAHSLKSSAAYVGAEALASLADELELRAGQGPSPQVGSLVERIGPIFESARDELTRELETDDGNAAAGLTEYFRERIPEKIASLVETRGTSETAPGAVIERVHRIAHALRGSAGSFGFPQISAAASLLEAAMPDQLDDALESLLATMQTAAEGEAVGSAIVLIVADQQRDVSAVRDALGQVAGEIRHVDTGSAALAAIAEDSIGLAIVDLVLPDMDGRSLLIKLRENPTTAAIPVFVTSGLRTDRIKAECLALGAQQFVEKPVNAEVLAAAVAATLRKATPAGGTVDPLTGLPNRAAFGETFRRASAFAQRSSRPLSVGILDLDCFKKVNDVHGHGVGDAVLEGAARALSAGLRESDGVARWGGEEFVVLFPDTPERGGVAALDKVREQLAEIEFETPSGKTLRVSFSGGVTQLRERESLTEVLARADGHLYRAKAAGRNRVFCADDACALPERTVLVVEDDDDTAMLIQFTLSKSTNAQIVRCRSGEEALERLGTTSVSLGIFDVNMPGMDGFALLERMQENPATAAIPIVMLTGRGSEEDVVRGFDHGAADYIVKPFSPPELVVRIRRLLNRTG